MPENVNGGCARLRQLPPVKIGLVTSLIRSSVGMDSPDFQ